MDIGKNCGTGLNVLSDKVSDKLLIKYNEIPQFPVTTAPGHEGNLIVGRIGNKDIMIMQGRFHPFEGYDFATCAMPIRIMKMVGVKTLIVTLTAGAINRSYNVGDIMIIKDHINFPGFAGNNPLIGINDLRFGPRFPATNNAYTSVLREKTMSIALKKLNFKDIIHEGIYAMTGGPAYETPAEIRLLKTLDVDSVGMSSCHEVMVAVHCGMNILGVAFVRNKNHFYLEEATKGKGRLYSSNEVKELKQTRRDQLNSLLNKFIEELDND
ncbi:hypothetical protein SNEBB_007831 [Seison nebaliae]|nr:hypothetical protein SNEBB_007831 [Seison nebaliae]